MNLSASPLRSVFVVIRHALNIVGALLAPFTVFFLIPRFTAIYHDMLGGQPLPPLTVFILRLQPLWALLAFAFVLAALYLVWRHRLNGPPASASIVLLLVVAAQFGLIFIALMIPLSGSIIRQLPPAP